MTELLGIVGSFLLSICGLPQALKAYKDGHSAGLSWTFIISWFLGEALLLIYVLLTSRDLILCVNYVFNILILIIIIKYKSFPRR